MGNIEEHLSMGMKPTVSVCVPAYNEEKNIKSILRSLLEQKLHTVSINKIVVVSSGSTDKTNAIVEEFCKKNPKVTLIKERERKGKSHAINTFLHKITDDIVVVESADTVPRRDTIENLCAPLLLDSSIGMTGGAPIPVNDRNTGIGYIVHTWWWFHRNIPRFGEIIAFRNIIDGVADTSAVDEAYIQARMIQLGYQVVHIDKAVVNNKGPENLKDLLIQRRRIFNGHARLHVEEGVKINNMTRSSLHLLLFKHKMHSVKELYWTLAGLAIEVYARVLGIYDQKIIKKNPFVWDTAKSTKNLSLDYDYDPIS